MLYTRGEGSLGSQDVEGMPHFIGVPSVVVLKVNQPAELSTEDMAMPKRGLDLQHALSKTTQTKMHFMAI